MPFGRPLSAALCFEKNVMKVKGKGFTSGAGSKEAGRIISRNSGVFHSFEATIRECKSFIKSVEGCRVPGLFPTQFQVYSPPFFCVKL